MSPVHLQVQPAPDGTRVHCQWTGESALRPADALTPDQLIRHEGMQALRKHLGLVESERFIALARREPFDYTEWQQGLWQDCTVDELFDAAKNRDPSADD